VVHSYIALSWALVRASGLQTSYEIPQYLTSTAAAEAMGRVFSGACDFVCRFGPVCPHSESKMASDIHTKLDTHILHRVSKKSCTLYSCPYLR